MGNSEYTTAMIRIAGTDQLILTKANYPRWKTSTLESFKTLKCDWMFRTDGLITSAEQKHLSDALGKDAVFGSNGSQISAAVAPKYSDEYITADRAASDFIYKTCCSEYQSSVSSLKTSIQRWKFLANLGQGSDVSSKSQHFEGVFNVASSADDLSCLPGLTSIQNSGKALEDIYGKAGEETKIPLSDILGIGAISFLNKG